MAEAHESTADTIRFVMDGRVVEVRGVSPTTTVLEYLRDTAGRTGTKEGCAEGDCGACTVVVGTLARDGSHIDYRAINSCIRFLPTIDGCELVTVESLLGENERLHPVQQAMVDGHASQCGFCTPGFVMSLFGLYLNSTNPSRDDVVRACAGNLCRCTGYRPIIDAGMRMGAYPEPARWSRSEAQAPSHVAALRAVQRTSSLALPRFIAPRTLAELAAALEAQPASLILAGGTDVGLWVTKQLRELPPIVYLGEVAELQQLQVRADSIEIGAAVSLTAAWQALVAAYSGLDELARRFASPPVCNSGTLCGNLANGSPIGDSMPALIAIGAELELRRGAAVRRVPLENFYRGYQQKDLATGEFVARVHVPAPRPGRRVASYKISKRFEQDISAVCSGFAVEIAGGSVKSARIAYGGMAAVPARAVACEQALVGKPWTLATIDAASAALAVDFKPLTDLRAGDAYRLQVAGNLLRRFYHEERGDVRNLRTMHAAQS